MTGAGWTGPIINDSYLGHEIFEVTEAKEVKNGGGLLSLNLLSLEGSYPSPSPHRTSSHGADQLQGRLDVREHTDGYPMGVSCPGDSRISEEEPRHREMTEVIGARLQASE